MIKVFATLGDEPKTKLIVLIADVPESESIPEPEGN